MKSDRQTVRTVEGRPSQIRSNNKSVIHIGTVSVDSLESQSQCISLLVNSFCTVASIRSNVQSNSSKSSHGKRMKKRKELDALLGSRGKKGYDQEDQTNLNSDVVASSSSRDASDTYFVPATHYNASSRRMGYKNTERNTSCCTAKQFFYFCVPACILALIAACLTSSIGIVWMQTQLKNDIDQMKNRMNKLERWKGDEPASLADIQNSISNIERDVIEMKQGDNGILVLHTNLASLTEQVENSENSSPDVHTSIKEAQDIVEKLQKSVYDLNTELSTIRNTLEDIQSQQIQVIVKSTEMKYDIDHLKEEMEETSLDSKRFNQHDEDIGALYKKFTYLNDTMQALCGGDEINRVESRNENDLSPLNVDHVNEQPDSNFPISPTSEIREESTHQTIAESKGSTSHESVIKVGDTTTSFTELPTGKRNTDT